MLYYFPLEPYKERYTMQLSRENDGWIERVLNNKNIPYVRINGGSISDEIKNGSVLDACGRGFWSSMQIAFFLRLMNEGQIKDNDILYFDDFFTPGIEAIAYAAHLMDIELKMYAMLHAQSVDIFDFTYPMRSWMRPLEQSYGKIFDGIFVTSTELKDLCVMNGIGTDRTVHITGLPYQSEEVKTHFPSELPKKKRQVIFTSRWDKEKDPNFFLEVVSYIQQNYSDPPNFLITTSSKKAPTIPYYLKDYITVKSDLTKEEYYFNLLESKIQFNCADQDWVSWTLLEAATCNCRPVYPFFRSFPEVLFHEHLYVKNNIRSAAEMIMRYIDEIPRKWDFIYKPFDSSFERCLSIMYNEKIVYPLVLNK